MRSAAARWWAGMSVEMRVGPWAPCGCGTSMPAACPALMLGPLAVDAEWRRFGVGARLMEEAITRASALGHRAIILVGDAPYYARFGFSRAHALGLEIAGSGGGGALPRAGARTRRADRGGGSGPRDRRARTARKPWPPEAEAAPGGVNRYAFAISKRLDAMRANPQAG